MAINALTIDVKGNSVSLWQLPQLVEKGDANAMHVDMALRLVASSTEFAQLPSLRQAVDALIPQAMLDETLGNMMASSMNITAKVDSDLTSDALYIEASLKTIMVAKGLEPKTIVFQPTTPTK